MQFYWSKSAGDEAARVGGKSLRSVRDERKCRGAQALQQARHFGANAEARRVENNQIGHPRRCLTQQTLQCVGCISAVISGIGYTILPQVKIRDFDTDLIIVKPVNRGDTPCERQRIIAAA